MKFLSSSAIFMLFFLNIAAAQNSLPGIYLRNPFENKICSHSENKIPAEITGEFGTGNKFTVEIMNPYSSELVASFEAAYSFGNFHFEIDDEIPLEGREINYRVSASSPKVQSNTLYARQFFNKGMLNIRNNSQAPDTLNAGSGWLLDFTSTTNNPVSVTLSDSTKIEIPYTNSSYTLSLPAFKTGEVFIVRAVNSCNIPVPSSGKASVVVNPVSILPGKINTPAVCDGGDIELTYSTIGGVIPDTAHFRLRFLRVGFSDPDENRILEVPAVKKQEGLLTARIQEQMIRNYLSFRVAIISDAPGLVSPYSEQFLIHEKPVASFRYQNDSTRIGEAYNMWFDVSGPRPYTLELSNGSSYLLDDNNLAKIYPLNTDSYEIRSLTTACGVTTDLPGQKVIISVKPGIAVMLPAEDKRKICENQIMRLPFVHNVELNGNTRYIAEGLTQNNKTYQFEARLINDSIEFLVPLSPPEWGDKGYFDIYSFRVRTESPAYTSAFIHGFTITGVPRVTYDTYESTALPYPGYLSYNLVVSGGLPFSYTDYNGNKSYADHMRKFERVFVGSSGNFAPRSVENGCYSTSDIPSLNLTANQYYGPEPVVIVHPPSAIYLCAPDSVEIYFDALGNFGADNEFQILIPGSTEEVWKTVKTPGRYKMPASLVRLGSYLNQNIRSTNPERIWSAAIPYLIDKKPDIPRLEEIGGITADNPRIFGIEEKPSVNIFYSNNTPFTAIFSDGSKDYHFVQCTNYATFYPPMERSKVTPIQIRSITNACGTTTPDLTTYLYWRQYRISLRGFPEGQVYCTGEEMTVPFVIESGSAPEGTVYRLRITKDHKEYTTLATTTAAGSFRYRIPDTFREGEYSIEVTADVFTSTGGTRVIVKKKPTARLSVSTPDNATPGQAGFGEEIKLDYRLTGGPPWVLTREGSIGLETNLEEFSDIIRIKQETTFKLSSVSNSCGYGDVSGEFLVRVIPEVVSLKPRSSAVCSGSTLEVDFVIGGDIPAGEKIVFSLTNPNGTRTDLKTVSSSGGTVSLPIADYFPPGQYTLTCRIGNTEAALSEQIRLQKAPVIELTGHTTINPGETTFIHINPKEDGDQEVLIQLSDGTQSQVRMQYPFLYGIKVAPSATSTYTIASASSGCGPVQYSGSATVIVNPSAGRTARVTGTSKANNSFCSNDTLLVYFERTGIFTLENYFTIHLFDSKGLEAATLSPGGKESPLKVVIPDHLLTRELYRLRVTASDAGTASSDYSQPMSFAAEAAASFAGTITYKDDAGKARVVVMLEGTGPWRYDYGNDLGSVQRYAITSPDTLLLESREHSAYFKLNSVTNVCGTGKIKAPSSIRIEVIAGLEDPGFDPVSAGPNPTRQEVIISFGSDRERQLVLFNLQGAELWQQSSFGSKTVIDLRHYPTGVYLLKIMNKDKVKTLRIVKY